MTARKIRNSSKAESVFVVGVRTSPAASGKIVLSRYSKTPAACTSKSPLGKRFRKLFLKFISDRLWYLGRYARGWSQLASQLSIPNPRPRGPRIETVRAVARPAGVGRRRASYTRGANPGVFSVLIIPAEIQGPRILSPASPRYVVVLARVDV